MRKHDQIVVHHEPSKIVKSTVAYVKAQVVRIKLRGVKLPGLIVRHHLQRKIAKSFVACVKV